MTTGVGPLLRPQQNQPPCELEIDNSYVLVRLHDTQAFFSAGWLAKAGSVIFTSSVESSYQPGTRTQSLHQITTIKKNKPCHLGILTNLTDWLPLRKGDHIRIDLKYIVVQDTPLMKLFGDMGKIDLVSKVSLIRPDWAVAMKVSQIVGQMLSHFAGEGSQHEVFSLKMDLNAADLRAGYYVIVGSQENVDWPTNLVINSQGVLSNDEQSLLDNLSFAVVEVVTLPRLGEEMARWHPWWELLQAAKDEARFAEGRSSSKILAQWQKALKLVRAMTRADRGFLAKELDEIITRAHFEVEQGLPMPSTRSEASGRIELPEEWQELLKVQTSDELEQSVKTYKASLVRSQKLLAQYKMT